MNTAPVVSTPTGSALDAIQHKQNGYLVNYKDAVSMAEGINYTKGVNILIADDANEFAMAIKTLFQDPEMTKSMGKEAQKLILRDHNTPKIIQQLVGFYRDIL